MLLSQSFPVALVISIIALLCVVGVGFLSLIAHNKAVTVQESADRVSQNYDNLLEALGQFEDEFDDLSVMVEKDSQVAGIAATETHASEFGYSIQLPEGTKSVNFLNDGVNRLECFERGDLDVEIRLVRGSKSLDGLLYLDQNSSGDYDGLSFDNRIFFFPNGYCDGPGGCSEPFVAVVG